MRSYRSIKSGLAKTSKLGLPVILSASMLMTTACGTQGFGVGRNPLGHGERPGIGAQQPGAAGVFDGNPEQLSALFLRTRSKAHLAPGQNLALEVIAVDRNGKLIDPSKLKLVFSSSEMKNVTVDPTGVLTGLIPFEDSLIKVMDEKTGISTTVDVTVGPKDFTGNPEALNSLELVLRQQTVPGSNEEAQYLVIAKDILGNPIDPARLRLEWSVSDPKAFKIDKNGLVTALLPNSEARVLVRDAVTGRMVSGTVRSLGIGTPATPGTKPGTTPSPVLSDQPGPNGPSSNGPGTTPVQHPTDGNPSELVSIRLTPASITLHQGEKGQYSVTLIDKSGKHVDPKTVNLQWFSGAPDKFDIDDKGVVTSKTPDNTNGMITVSVPGKNLSATAEVRNLPRQSNSGGGGGGGGGTVAPAPGTPGIYTSPFAVDSFHVHIVPPTSGGPVDHYRLTISGLDGPPVSFDVPPSGSGEFLFDIPVPTGLDPDTSYPVTLVAVGGNSRESAAVDSIGTTLKLNSGPSNAPPTNLFAGTPDFSGIIPMTVNTPRALNRASGTGLQVGDPNTPEVLTATLNFLGNDNAGTLSITGTPANVTITGDGTSGNQLIITGAPEDVSRALDGFVYTPATNFQGTVSVRMYSNDDEALSDTDILTFSVNNATPAPPVNAIDDNTNFGDFNTDSPQLTGRNTDLVFNTANGNAFSVSDANGDTLNVLLTPSNGSVSNLSGQAGVTVTPEGNNLRLVGHPLAINSLLAGGIRFTPSTDYAGAASINISTSAPDGSDSDTVNINVLEPGNLFRGNRSFGSEFVGTERGFQVTLEDANELQVVYPAGTNVRVSLTLTDGNGGNPDSASHGGLSFVDDMGLSTTSGTASITIEGDVSAVNAALAAGVMYTPPVNTSGSFRILMQSVDTNNPTVLNDNLDNTSPNADFVYLKVSARPINRYNNNPSAFPPINNAIQLVHNSSLTFEPFRTNALSVNDDDTDISVIFTPSVGDINRSSAPPAGVTQTGAGTPNDPLVFSGPRATINAMFNTGVTFRPPTGFQGPATVTMTSRDPGNLEDTDIVHINVLGPPENRLTTNAGTSADFVSFSDNPLLGRPAVALALDGSTAYNTPKEPLTFASDVRRLGIANYADGTDIEVELRVPSGSLTIGNANGTTLSGNNSGAVNLTGTQANINLALATLSFTPAAIGAPTTVPLTIYSTSGTAEDGLNGVDLANFLITAAPLNEYRSQGPASNPTAPFPSGGSSLRVYNTVPLNFDGSQELSGSFVLSPDPLLRVNDDSQRVIVTLTPANNTILSLTGTPPGNVISSGGMTANNPLVIEGSPDDVNSTLALLRFNNNGYLGATTIQMSSFDGAATPVSNNIEINVVPLPQNAHNGSGTFTSSVLPIVSGSAQSLPGGNLNLIGTSSYPVGETVTVRLELPDGAGTLSVSGDSNADPDIVEISGLVDGSGNVPSITAALAGLSLNLNASPNSPVTLTMTSGPLADTDTLQLRPSQAIVNNYNGSGTFGATAVIVNEGLPTSFNGGNASNPTLSVVDDSPSVRVTLTPGLVGGNNSGTLSVSNQGVSVSGLGTNASPLVLAGTPANVNATLATLSFSSAAGINGATTVTMLSDDFSSTDTDSVNLDVRAQPSNRMTLDGSTSNTFSGTGNSRSVSLNSTYLLDGFNSGTPSLDRPLVQVAFYNPADTVTVNLSLAPNNGTLQVTSTTSTVSGNNTANLQLVGTPAQVNADLATLGFNSTNTGGIVDMQMLSTNGTVGDNTANQDLIRFNVQNQPPVNSLSNTTSGFVNVAGNTPLPLRVVSDTTNVEDQIDFGQTDPTSAAAGSFTVTGNTWPTLSISDDDTSLTTTVTPPATGTLSDRSGSGFLGTGASVSGAGTNVSPFAFTGSPAQINAALLRLRFTPNAGVASGTTASLQIQTVDGASQSDTDTVQILVERPNLPLTFSSAPNPSGPVFRAVYQFGRDRLPQIVVNDVAVSGPEIQNGAQIEIIRYNENDPLTTADDDTDVLRTVTLNNPASNESVSFNNQTNRATITVNFPADSPLPVPGSLNDGVGKIGARLSGGNIDTPSEPDFRNTATHPFDFFVYPERAQFAVEDYFSGANNRGRWYLINTSTSAGSGLGRLTMVFDSNGALNIQNGLNATTDVTAGLAKNPINGDVYYVDQQGTSPNFSGQLVRWIPSRGVQNDRGGSNSATDPFLLRGTLSVVNGLGLTYSFGDKPARLEFNSTDNGGTKTATLYAGAAYNTVDGAGSLSGFYRIRNFESGTVATDHIKLIFNGEEFGLNTSYLNNGDIVFEPDTDSTAAANNRMFLTNNNKLYVTTAPVPDTGTANVTIQEVSLAGIAATLQLSSDPATQIVGLSIDGEWTAGSRSLLMITRYSGAGNTSKSRLYRVSYDSSYAITGATLLGNGDFQTPEYTGPIPLVDITAAHQP